MIDHVERDSHSKKVDCNAKACCKRQASEISWTERAQVCCFYYHSAIENKGLALTSVVYSLNRKTIEGWCRKSSMIPTWCDLARNITVSQILTGLSEQ